MDKLDAAGKRGASAGLWKHSRTFLSWCVELGYIDVHPLANVRRRRKGSRAERLEREAKGRALSFEEIPAVWAAAGRMKTFGLLTQFSLLAGTRRAEAAQLKWCDVLTDRIVIPAKITKTGKPHEIPKTELLSAVLEAAQQFRRASSDYVFPSARTGGPSEGFNTMLPRLVRDAGIARFTMHDLRRTARTRLGELGHPNALQRLCVGQQVDPLDGAYNKGDHWDERCAAFKAYHHRVASLVGGNVISFQDAQAFAAG